MRFNGPQPGLGSWANAAAQRELWTSTVLLVVDFIVVMSTVGFRMSIKERYFVRVKVKTYWCLNVVSILSVKKLKSSTLIYSLRLTAIIIM